MKAIKVKQLPKGQRPKPNIKEIEITQDKVHNSQDEHSYTSLEHIIRQELHSLGNREREHQVGNHIAKAITLIESNPQEAVKEAQEALRYVSRLATIREILGVAAYNAGDYHLAIKELKTFQRLTNIYDHLPMIADSYRGLGEPRRVFDDSIIVPARHLSSELHVEFTIVLAGAYADLGRFDAAQATLKKEARESRSNLTPDGKIRLREAQATFYEMAGDTDKANQIWEETDQARAKSGELYSPKEPLHMVYDLLEEDA